MLVSLRNIDILQSYEPSYVHIAIFEHTVFGSAISGPIMLIFSMGAQETIIYRVPIGLEKSMVFNAYFAILIFWVRFGGELGVAATRALLGIRLQN